ncbi:Versiconal hemiacetal acetate esterase, partial [Pseudocercospora fuligena]
MLLSPEELSKTSVIDPQVLEYAKNNPQPPLNWDDWKAVRDGLALVSQQTLALLGPTESTIVEQYQNIPMRDGVQSKLKIVKPVSSPVGGSPLIVFFFGGGWISGDIEAGTAFARAYALARSLEEKLMHPITGQFLCVPSIMTKEHVPEKYQPYFLSHEQNKDAPILPTDALRSLFEHTSWDSTSYMRYPILSKAPLSQQPPAYIQVDGMDPLRDEALIWDELLKEAGVKTRVDLYPGCPHAHFGFMPGIEPTTKAIGDAMIGVGWLLGRSVTMQEGLAAMVPQTA